MIKPIVINKKLLIQKSEPCDLADIESYVTDLMDTAMHHGNCAGLAANQIGILKQAFVLKSQITGKFMAIINPEIISFGGGIGSEYETCLSLPNERPVRKRRHKKIKIRYFNVDIGNIVMGVFKRFEARIVQHEMDHFKGILI